MVITDARLCGISGYELLGKVHVRWPQLPILMITAYATPKLAVEAIKAGAFDYLAKPFAPEELLHAVERCSERHNLLHQNAALIARATETYQIEQIVGDSPVVCDLRQMIQTVAPTGRAGAHSRRERHWQGTGRRGKLHCLSERRKAKAMCASIARQFPKRCLKANYLATKRALSPGRSSKKPAAWRRPTAEAFSWMKLRT